MLFNFENPFAADGPNGEDGDGHADAAAPAAAAAAAAAAPAAAAGVSGILFAAVVVTVVEDGDMPVRGGVDVERAWTGAGALGSSSNSFGNNSLCNRSPSAVSLTSV